MKHYIIFGSHKAGYYTSVVSAKNKYRAIENTKKHAGYDNFVPILCKRISKKYCNFIIKLNGVNYEKRDIR